MKKVLYLFLILTATLLLSGCDFLYANHPTFSCVEDFEIGLGEEVVNPNCDIKALSKNEGDITENIVITGDVDNTVPGTYQLTYSVRDSTGKETTETVTVTVKDMQLSYPTGTYNYRFANTELRYTFLAAAEKWLVENQIGGIPLLSKGSVVSYTYRVLLPTEQYIPVMGYGHDYGSMTMDDQSVIMFDGTVGNENQFTFRDRINENPITFNQWMYDTYSDSKVMNYYYDSLYKFEFNDDLSGFAIKPSMSTDYPKAVNPTVLNNGQEMSTVWRVSIRDDLKWYYHPNIKTEIGFDPCDYQNNITANDFIDTFKLAFDEEWFRAVSGGGDFVMMYRIKGLMEYSNGEIPWEEVGIKVIDDYTIEFEFEEDWDQYSITYFLNSFVMTPISLNLYDYLEGKTETYGSSPYTIGYHGAYYIDEYIEDTVIRLKENPNYHSPDKYFYTGHDFLIIQDDLDAFNAFVEGKLDIFKSPIAAGGDSYGGMQDKVILGPTVYRLMINSLKTTENQIEYNPSSTWVPEPILGNYDFKDAMFFAIDRNSFKTSISRSVKPSMYYFNQAYILDPQQGIPFRTTQYGQSVGEKMYPGTTGYNPQQATYLFKSAVDQLLAEGYYQEGTEESPYVIEIRLLTYLNSELFMETALHIEEQFESLFVYEDKFITVDVIIEERDYPNIYHDYMIPGEFDIAIGGISGNLLCPSSYLDMFRSDNKSGFFLNPGVDTSKAEIEVRYVDDEGNYHREMWSFDAISTVLMEDVYIENGVEILLPDFVN